MEDTTSCTINIYQAKVDKVRCNKDLLYSTPLENIVDFQFDENVASVFSDMIQRSVPGYASIIANIGIIAEHHMQANSNCYDLGCSLGAATMAVRNRIHQPGCKIIAVDNSSAMLKRCRDYIRADDAPVEVDIIERDIAEIKIDNASLVILNFTLQFIEVDKREALIKKIYDGLLPNGILVLSEKIACNDLKENELQIQLHHAFKKANGYSDLEISQKRTALENILIPETFEAHKQRLRSAGFDQAYQWFQCYNFVSLLAIK